MAAATWIVLIFSSILRSHGYVDMKLHNCALRCEDENTDSNREVDQKDNNTSVEEEISEETLSETEISQCPQTAYVIHETSTSNYIRVNSPMPTTNKLTICMWVKQGQYGGGQVVGAVVSYATTTKFNTLAVFYQGKTVKYFTQNIDKGELTLPLEKGVENFVCFTSSRSEGVGKIYYNGTAVKTLSYSNRDPIPSGGAFLIGQEQDAYFGGFESSQAFFGEIRNFMIWDRVLTDGEIEGMFQSKCNCAAGRLTALTLDQIQLVGAVTALHVEDDCP